MKISITEKQLNSIKKNINVSEIGEEAPPPSTVTSTPTPSSSTSPSTSSTDSSAYPQVGKWESGVTRGPSNQVGNTKWSDIVGSSLKRGKANPLK